MPDNIPDLAWYVQTGLVVTLMGVIAGLLGWGFIIIKDKFKEITTLLSTLIDRITVWEQKTIHLEERLKSHVALDDERHKRIDGEFERYRGNK